MKWKYLRRQLWRRADWSVVRGYPKQWKLRLPSGRYISKAEVMGYPDHAEQDDETCERNAAKFPTAQDAMAWLDANHPTEDVYDAAD